MTDSRYTALALVVGALVFLAAYPSVPKAPETKAPVAPAKPAPRRPWLRPFRDPAPFSAGPRRGEFKAAGPVSPFDGTPAQVDLVKELRLHNTGGLGRGGPGTGAGLCVFTSAEHSGRHQNVAAMWGFQKWMTSRPGGGYPSKFDSMMQRFAPGVRYVQDTSGDPSLLELVLNTGRSPDVTYAGRDGVVYRTRIAHMVNLMHLDDRQAAILDNNNEGVYLWMHRDDFVERWRDMNGGWMIAFLDSPPSPVPVN